MAETIKGLTITVGADTKQFNKEMRAVNRDISSTNRQANELQRSLALEFDNDRFTEAQRLAQKAITDTEAKVQSLRGQLKHLEDTGADKTSANYQKLQTELVQTESRAVSLRKKLEDINNLKVEHLAKQFEDVGAGITKAGQALAPFSAAAAGTLAGLGAMFKNTKDTAATLDDMRQEVNLSAEALQKWQYIAAQQGLDQATLQNSLIKTQQAFSKLMIDGTGPGAEALMALGFSAEEAAKGMDANFEVMLGRLAGVADATQQAYLANEIFGNRMGAKIIPMLNGGAEGLKELTAEFEALGFMTDDQITAMAEFDDELLRIKTALGAIKDQLSVALIPVMETLATFMSTRVVPAIREMAEWFQGLTEGQQATLLGTLAIVAALAPLLLIIGKLTTGMGGLVKGISGVSKALTTLMAHPIIAVIAAIAALLIYLYTTNEQFRESINGLVATLGEALMPILETLGEALGQVIQALGPLIDAIAAILIPVIEILIQILEPLIALFSAVFITKIQAMMPMIMMLVNLLSSMAQVIKKVLVPVLEFMGTIFEKVFGKIKGVIDGTIGYIEKAINKMIDLVNWTIRQINKLGKYIGFTLDELDHVEIKLEQGKTPTQKDPNPVPPSASDVIGQTPIQGLPNIITNNDYSNKDIKIEVKVENYAENVDVDDMVRQINIKLAEQM